MGNNSSRQWKVERIKKSTAAHVQRKENWILLSPSHKQVYSVNSSVKKYSNSINQLFDQIVTLKVEITTPIYKGNGNSEYLRNKHAKCFKTRKLCFRNESVEIDILDERSELISWREQYFKTLYGETLSEWRFFFFKQCQWVVDSSLMALIIGTNDGESNEVFTQWILKILNDFKMHFERCLKTNIDQISNGSHAYNKKSIDAISEEYVYLKKELIWAVLFRFTAFDSGSKNCQAYNVPTLQLCIHEVILTRKTLDEMALMLSDPITDRHGLGERAMTFLDSDTLKYLKQHKSLHHIQNVTKALHLKTLFFPILGRYSKKIRFVVYISPNVGLYGNVKENCFAHTVLKNKSVLANVINTDRIDVEDILHKLTAYLVNKCKLRIMCKSKSPKNVVMIRKMLEEFILLYPTDSSSGQMCEVLQTYFQGNIYNAFIPESLEAAHNSSKAFASLCHPECKNSYKTNGHLLSTFLFVTVENHYTLTTRTITFKEDSPDELMCNNYLLCAKLKMLSCYLKKLLWDLCRKCYIVPSDELVTKEVKKIDIQTGIQNHLLSYPIIEPSTKMMRQRIFFLNLLNVMPIIREMAKLCAFIFAIPLYCATYMYIMRPKTNIVSRRVVLKSSFHFLALCYLMCYSINERNLPIKKAFIYNDEHNTYEELKLFVKCLQSSNILYSVIQDKLPEWSLDVSKTKQPMKAFLYKIINHMMPTLQRKDIIQVLPISNPDMSNEMMRLFSLSKFPDDNIPSFIRLAQFGFYSKGKGRELLCFSCGVTYENWSYHTNPLDIHRNLSPGCEFFKKVHQQVTHAGFSLPRLNIPLNISPRLQEDCSYRPSISNNHESNSVTKQTEQKPPQIGSYAPTDEANRFCTDSSESSNPTLLVSSSGTPQSFNGNPSSGHLSSDSGYYESSLCFGSRSSHGRFNSSIARNSAFVTSRSAGAESGLPTSKTGSSYSNEYGCGNSAFKSSVSSGSSGYGSSDSGYNSNNSSSSRSNASNLTLPQLSTLSENCLENVQNNSNVGPKERPQNTPKEKYPEYIDIAKRRASYKTWPSELHFLHPLDLADCGFFYSNFGDCVRCFHCGIGLRNWETDDNPWVEHARWSRKCPYLRQKKGQEFIDQVLTILGLQTDAEIEQQVSGAASAPTDLEKSSAVKDPIQHPAAQYIITEQIFGEIKERTIKKAMNQLLQQHEWKDITNERLVDFLLENRETIENSDAKANQINMSEMAEPRSQSESSNSKEENPAPSDTDPEKIQKENEELKDLYTCKICLDEKVGITFVPCGHLVTCKNCSPKIKRCPLCRTFIRGTIKTTI